MLNFEALRTPPHDGEVLIEPAAADLCRLTNDNRSLSSARSGPIAGIDWEVLRRRTRRVLGVDEQTPVIMTGHQPEFMHPGVWAKHVVAQRLAAAMGGAAVNLVVDNDAPKSLALAVPVAAGDGLALHRAAFAEKGVGMPYEFLPALHGSAIEQVRDAIARLMDASYDASAMPAFFEGFSSADGGDFVDQMVSGRQAAEELFGAAVRNVRVSRVWGGAILADWLRRPREFAEAYNRALAEYRREEGVRSPDRPIPDLHVAGERVELPLWVYGPGEPRRRLFVEAAAGSIRLFAETDALGRITSKDLNRLAEAQGPMAEDSGAPHIVHGKVIRPRALTLTLWARLLASDLFIHGIGGAKYDRITDKIIRHYYGFDPPAMACVSATLHLPLPHRPVSTDELTAARRRLRDVQYQPDGWADGIAEAAPLLAERRAAIDRSDSLRRSENGRSDHAARRETFERIRNLNARLVAMRPEIVTETRAALARLEDLAQQDRIATGREYFFALFPREKLEALCAALPAVEDF